MAFELKHNRLLPITVGRNSYVYTVRPIAPAEWLAYFEGITYEQTNRAGDVVTTTENTSARLKLLHAALVTVSGYIAPGGVADVTEVEGWRDLLPMKHRIAVANLLFEVSESAGDDAPIALGVECVALDALGGMERGGTTLVQHRGLKHIFTVPSVDQQRRYSRDASRSRVTGGRSGKTQFLGAQATLVALYDELIQSVSGYTADGTPLVDDRAAIVASMDGYHKAQAMGLVFSPAEADVQQD